MIFHLGALWRLNELGLLPKIKRFSSVSGGSITNGALAYSWKRLNFDSQGVAVNFEEMVARPLLGLAARTLDVWAVLSGLLPTQSASRWLAAAYDSFLFHGATLQELPLEPRFTFNATNLMSAGLLRISPQYAADYRVGKIDRPRFRLADVVAASSAFPPCLSPFDLSFRGQPMVPWPSQNLARPPFTERAVLTDRGVYDNLGLETVW